MPPQAVLLASLAPGALVAPAGHQAACDSLAESLLGHGYALIDIREQLPELDAARHAVADFWEQGSEEKGGLRPAQLRDGVGYRQLTDERELIDHRVGPWLRADAPLPALAAASQALDPIARTALAALCRSSFVRLPGAALAPALDDLPLPPQAWAASSLQCFRYRAGSSGCEAHEDRALLTLLYAPGEPGLQVRDAGGQWRSVQLGPTQLLLMAGHALEYATCGLIRSSQHRVVLEGSERRSLAYKLAAQAGAAIHLLPALQAAGHDLGAVVHRFPQPATYREIMERFEATHRTANPPAQHVAAAAAAAGPAGGAAGEQQRAPKRAHGEAPPAMVQDVAEHERLIIHFQSLTGNRVTFRVKRAMPLSRLVDAYCAKTGMDPSQLFFVFEGTRCRWEDTVDELGLEDGDVVDVLVEQRGD